MKPSRWVVGAGRYVGEVSTEPVADPAVLAAIQRPGVPLLFLSDLYVPPTRRGRGWSHLLIDAAVRYAARVGADLWLYASPYGKVAPGQRRPTARQLEKLYMRHGFLPAEPATYEHEMVLRCPALKRR